MKDGVKERVSACGGCVCARERASSLVTDDCDLQIKNVARKITGNSPREDKVASESAGQ